MVAQKDREDIVEFPSGVIAELDTLRVQDWRRGVIKTVDGSPVKVTRHISPQTGSQRRRDGKYGWVVQERNVNLYLGKYLGEYRPGTRVLTDVDPTKSKGFKKRTRRA